MTQGKGRERLRKHIPCKAEVRKILKKRLQSNVSQKREKKVLFVCRNSMRNGIAVRITASIGSRINALHPIILEMEFLP